MHLSGSSSHGSSSRHARTSAAVLGILLSASLLSACADDDAVPELPEGVDEDDTYLPSAEPSAENPHGTEDIDVSQDVGMAAVNTVISEHEGRPSASPRSARRARTAWSSTSSAERP